MSRSIVHVRRKKKDADPLRSAWHILEDWLEVNRQRILTIGAVALGLAALFGLAYYFLEYRAEQRQRAFAEAYGKYTATVGAATATQGMFGGSKVTYPDAQTKYAEAAAAFDALADDYSAYEEIGRYYAGLSYLEIEPAKGVERLEPLASGESDVRYGARLALAEHYDRAGDLAKSEQYYQSLADDPGNYPRFYAVNQLASVKERLGKTAEAAQLYKTVVDAERNTAFGATAEKGLQRVDPAAAAALPPKAPPPGSNQSFTQQGGVPGAMPGGLPGGLPPGF